MGRRYAFSLADKKIPKGSMAVKLPVDSPGIVTGDIRPVIRKLIAFPVMGFAPLLSSPGFQRKGGGFFGRTRKRKKTGFGRYGISHGQGKPEKKRSVKDDKPFAFPVIGPPLLNRKPAVILCSRIGIMTYNAAVFGFKAELTAYENSRKPPKITLLRGIAAGVFDYKFPLFSGVYVFREDKQRKRPCFPAVKETQEQDTEETVSQDGKKNRSQKGEGKFIPRLTGNESQNRNKDDKGSQCPGNRENADYPFETRPLTGSRMLFSSGTVLFRS